MPANYDFRSLSDREFEHLVRDLLQAEWGVTLEYFSAGRDTGLDFRNSSSINGATTIQCKHYAGSRFSQLFSKLKKEEVPKVRALCPRRYLIATSLGLTPSNKQKIVELFRPFLHGPEDVLGRDDLNNLLTKHSHVERSHIKLWLTSQATLDRVIHNAQLCRTEFEVQRIYPRLRRYVQTDDFSKARKILEEQRVLILSGIPGVGKTTLAEVLLYLCLEQGYTPIVLRSRVEEGLDLFNPAARQVFYFDDFLGESFLGDQRWFHRRNEDVALVRMIELAGASASTRLIMTTREHILNDACMISERFNTHIVRDVKCLMRLEQYTLAQRAAILENHIHFSDLPPEYRSRLTKAFHRRVVTHLNFNPRIIEWMTSYSRIRHIRPEGYEQHALEILQSPECIWQHAFHRQISDAARSLLITLASLDSRVVLGVLAPAWETLHEHRASRYRFTRAPEELRTALRDLEGAFLVLERAAVRFLNPSVSEFARRLISSSHDHIADLLSSACYCRQIRWLWELQRAPDSTVFRGHLYTLRRQLVAALVRILSAPIDTELNLHLEEPADDPPHIQLELLVEIAAPEDDQLWQQADPLIERLIDDDARTHPYYEVLISALVALEDARWDASAARVRLETELFRCLDWASSAGLGLIWRYVTRPDAPTEHREIVGAAIRRSLRECVLHESFDMENFEMLEEELSDADVPIDDPEVNKKLQEFSIRRGPHPLYSGI